MIVMFRMSPEKKDKMIKKLEKMEEFIEEFKECLDESEDMDEEEMEEVQYRSPMYRKGSSSGSSARYRYRMK